MNMTNINVRELSPEDMGEIIQTWSNRFGTTDFQTLAAKAIDGHKTVHQRVILMALYIITESAKVQHVDDRNRLGVATCKRIVRELENDRSHEDNPLIVINGKPHLPLI